jgi:hypothetical protein
VAGSYEDLSNDEDSLELSLRKSAEPENRAQDEVVPVDTDHSHRISNRILRLVHQSSMMETPVDTSGAMKMTYWF